jgi:hypothetical protein
MVDGKILPHSSSGAILRVTVSQYCSVFASHSTIGSKLSRCGSSMRGCTFAVKCVVQRACVRDLRVASARGPVDSDLRLPNYSPQNIARVCLPLTPRNGRRWFPRREAHARA